MDDEFNLNDLPFKLRYTSTEKLCKEIVKLIDDRHEMVDKLMTEVEFIDKNKEVLTNIKSDLELTNHDLKQLRDLCQCQGDDDKKQSLDKTLARFTETMEKLQQKHDAIVMMKNVNVVVKKLPNNWRATMMRLIKENQLKRAAESEPIPEGVEPMEEGPEQPPEPVEMKHEETLAKEKEQFEVDLSRKMYEAQVEDILTMGQHLTMRIKTLKAQLDIGKQLIKLLLKTKREYENVNSKLRDCLASCHCAIAGDEEPQDEEQRQRAADKKRLEEQLEATGSGLKYWEEQYQILKESRMPKKPPPEEPPPPAATTTIEVAQDEDMPSMSQCMYQGAGIQPVGHSIGSVGHPLSHSSLVHHSGGGTSNPAVIYLEGLVGSQPTYLNPGSSAIHQPIGVYPGSAFQALTGHHPATATYHQAPDGSIQVYTSDIAPSYIAYQ